MRLLCLKIKKTSFEHHELHSFSGIVDFARPWLKFTPEIVLCILICFRTSNYLLFINCLLYYFTGVLVVLICCLFIILLIHFLQIPILTFLPGLDIQHTHSSMTYEHFGILFILDIIFISLMYSEPKPSTVLTV